MEELSRSFTTTFLYPRMKKVGFGHSQSAAPAPAPGNGAFPEDFKLRAVYGNFALATDTTTLKGGSLDGVYRGMRMFVKENGKWRVAGAMFTPLTRQ